MLLTIDIYYINNSDKLNLYIIYVSKDGYFHEYQKSITLPADELYIYQEYIAQKTRKYINSQFESLNQD